jgi:3-oxoadipate enol-lactonase
MTEHFNEELGIYYRVNAFLPGRRTLVFVHGLSGSSSTWQWHEARFESQYNLLTYDLRGHGKSKKYLRCSDYEIPHFAEDLSALLQYLAIDRCVLISHSFAVLIALEFLRVNQSSVEGAVLLSGDYDIGRNARAKVLKSLLGPVALLEGLPFHPGAGRHIDYAQYPNSGDFDMRRLFADVRNTTWRVFLYCTKLVFAVHHEFLLGDIRVPVLLMHGRKDRIFSVENSIYMATRIPRAELVIVDDVDHILVLNRPREVGDAIESFARQLAPQVRGGAALQSGPQPVAQGHDCERRRTGDEDAPGADGL